MKLKKKTFCIEFHHQLYQNSVKSFCDHFSKDFVDKIETIGSKFPDKVQNIPPVQKTEIR